MVATDLCESCARLPFRLLRLPLLSDVPLIKAGNLPDKLPYRSEASLRQTKVNIGYLSEIKTRQDCPICSYIWQTLSALDVYTTDGLTRHGSKQVMCQADIGKQYAIFRYPEKDSDDQVTLYRLAFATFIDGHQHHDVGKKGHIYMDNHFHACEVGAGSKHARRPSHISGDVHDKALFGGRMRPLLADITLLKSWLNMCEDEHGPVCNDLIADDTFIIMPKIRFIDVKRQCLITHENMNLSKVQYLALSYVWGNPPRPGSRLSNRAVLELNSRTFADLHTEGSLQQHVLPATIDDTLDLAEKLEIPYVWIDRLCIQQDSDRDKSAQISRMHLIYNCSHVTVVAAAGEGADHGLPGLRSGTRKVAQKEILVVEPCNTTCTKSHEHDYEGLSLLTTVDPFLRSFSYLNNAVWSSRGWTLQERYLARRSLIFTQEQIRFACSDGEYSEETDSEVPFPRLQSFSLKWTEYGLRQSVRAYGESSDERVRFWNRFGLLVERFTERSFTFPGDLHDGFAAITQALAVEAKDRFVWGIPASQFELGLLWTTYQGQIRRQELTTLPMTNLNVRVTYPSWSWMGWIGPTAISLGPEPLESVQPTIECYVHRPGDNGHCLMPVAEQPDVESPVQSARPAVTWKQDERPRAVTMELLRSQADFDTDRLLDVPMNHLLFFWASKARLMVSSSNIHTSPLRSFSTSLGVICNECYTVEQHLSGATNAEVSGERTIESYGPNILDAHGQVLGSLSRMKKEHWDSGGLDNGYCEFIVVGRRHIAELGDDFPASLLVMQVEEKDGIWYRVSIGEVDEAAWEASNPVWSLTVLG